MGYEKRETFRHTKNGTNVVFFIKICRSILNWRDTAEKKQK